MVTIVYSHPYDKSFNNEILNQVTQELAANGREYKVINLYQENFNPVLGMADYAVYPEGKTTDEEVKEYQQILEKTNHLIFIFPIWWGMMPAILKGFIDKTFLKGTIYDTTPDGAILPCLDIERTSVFTTSQQDTVTLAPFMEGYFFPQVLNTVGINNIDWHNCPKTLSSTPDRRARFIAEILATLKDE